MAKVTRTKALEILAQHITELEGLANTQERDTFRLRAAITSLHATARELFGENSHESANLARVSFDPDFDGFQDPPPIEYVQAYVRGLIVARNLVVGWSRHIENFWPDEPKPSSATSSSIDLAVCVCDGFARSVRRLRKRHGNDPALLMRNEYDVQYLLEALLAVHFDDIVAEDPAPHEAGGNSRIDFVLSKERIAIETKMTRDGLDERKVGQELLTDIGRYGSHAGIDALICFVYDPDGRIENPRKLERDLEKQSTAALAVHVLVRPKS